MRQLASRVNGRIKAEIKLAAQRRFFTDLINRTGNFADVTWLGTPIWQNVLDLWTIQEAIAADRPAVLLETGTYHGGSALFYANLFDLLGYGRVITVDVERLHDIEHPRVTWLIGSSIEEEVMTAMREAASTAEGAVMVILDSDHSAAHVRAELECYSPLVTAGSLILVQDGLIDELPSYARFRPGPLPAIQEFLAEHPEFTLDAELDRRFLVTHHPSGWLRRR